MSPYQAVGRLATLAVALVLGAAGRAGQDDAAMVQTLVEGVCAREALVEGLTGQATYLSFTNEPEVRRITEAALRQAVASGLDPDRLELPDGRAGAVIRFGFRDGAGYYEAVSLDPGAHNAPGLPVSGPVGARYALGESAMERRSCLFPGTAHVWPQAELRPGQDVRPATWQPLAQLLMLGERVLSFGAYLRWLQTPESFRDGEYARPIIERDPGASGWVAYSGEEEVGDPLCHILTASATMSGWRSDMVLWIAPEVGYAVVRAEERVREHLTEDRPQRLRRWVAEGSGWEEVSPSVWFPAEIRLTEYDYRWEDPWIVTKVMRVTSVELGGPFPEALFHVDLPLGAMVHDALGGGHHQVGEVDREAAHVRDATVPEGDPQLLDPPQLAPLGEAR